VSLRGRYLFDLEDADGLTTDETGGDFPTFEEMKRAAIDELHEVSREDGGFENIQTHMNVRDQAGKVVFAASLSIRVRMG
jgi:hypothetical protein